MTGTWDTEARVSTAITVLLDRTEKITKPVLEAITLDHLAEQHYRPRTPARTPTTPSAGRR